MHINHRIQSEDNGAGTYYVAGFIDHYISMKDIKFVSQYAY